MTTEEQNIIDAIKSGEIVEAVEPIYNDLKKETQDFICKNLLEEDQSSMNIKCSLCDYKTDSHINLLRHHHAYHS